MSNVPFSRRSLLQLGGAGIVGAAIGTTSAGAQEDDQASAEDEYDDILAEMDGDGSSDNPYVITSVVELQAMDGDRTANYVLGNDIDASSTEGWNEIEDVENVELGPVSVLRTGEENSTVLPFGPIVEDSETIEIEDFPDRETVDPSQYTIDYETGEISFDEEPARAAATLIASYELVESVATGFDPIGPSSVDSFDGTLDGDGAAISNLFVRRLHESDVGVFGAFDGDGTLENISFENMHIEGGVSGTGIIGHARTMTANSVTIDGTIIGLRDVGGFAGRGREPHLSNLELDVTVVGGRDIGGCLGSTPSLGEETKMTDSTIDATISIEQERVSSMGVAGGVVGRGNDIYCDELIVDTTVTGRAETSGNGGGFGRFDSGECTDSVFKGDVLLEEAPGDMGGIAGQTRRVDITDCEVDVSVTGNQIVGGAVGSVEDDTLITGTHVTGDVDGTQRVGGFVGRHSSGVIRQCSADNTVTSDSEVGGFVGRADGGSFDWPASLIDRCFSSGTVTNRADGPSGNNVTGGFAGENMGDDTVIERAYSTDTVVSNAEAVDSFREGGVGGFVGNNSATIKSAYRAGETTGEINVGGFVGNPAPTEDDDPLIQDIYWDTDQTEQSEISGMDEEATDGTAEFAGEIEGLTTDEMQGETAATAMSQLDFDTVWEVVTDPDDYPSLRIDDSDEPGGPDDDLVEAPGGVTIPSKYAEADSTVGTGGLLDAGTDFRNGDADINTLLDVGTAFQNS